MVLIRPPLARNLEMCLLASDNTRFCRLDRSMVMYYYFLSVSCGPQLGSLRGRGTFPQKSNNGYCACTQVGNVCHQFWCDDGRGTQKPKCSFLRLLWSKNRRSRLKLLLANLAFDSQNSSQCSLGGLVTTGFYLSTWSVMLPKYYPRRKYIMCRKTSLVYMNSPKHSERERALQASMSCSLLSGQHSWQQGVVDAYRIPPPPILHLAKGGSYGCVSEDPCPRPVTALL